MSRRQPRSAHLSAAPVQTFPTADGWIFIMCMTDKFWIKFADALVRADLKTDARFTTPAMRQRNRDALTQVLDQELRKRPTRTWIDATIYHALHHRPPQLCQAMHRPRHEE